MSPSSSALNMLASRKIAAALSCLPVPLPGARAQSATPAGEGTAPVRPSWSRWPYPRTLRLGRLELCRVAPLFDWPMQRRGDRAKDHPRDPNTVVIPDIRVQPSAQPDPNETTYLVAEKN